MGGQKVKVKAQDAAMSGKQCCLAALGLQPSLVSQRRPGACGKLREGLGVKAGTDQRSAEPSSTAMGLRDGPTKQGCCDNITFALHLTQNYTISMEALLLFLSWIRLFVLKWEVRDLLWSLYNDLGNLRIPFSPTQVQVYCQTMSDFCPLLKMAKQIKSFPS